MSATNSDFFWFYQDEHNILVLAVAFGLGPRIAAENLLLDMEVIEEGEIHWKCKEDGEDLAALEGLIEVRLLLNFGVLSAFPDFEAERRVWVDCVDWLRKTIPRHIQKYDLLLREEFFPSPESGEKGEDTKWHSVKPLTRPPIRAATPDSNLILLSFGGVETPFSTDEHRFEMPMVFLQAVKECLEQFADKKVLAFLPEKLFAKCEADPAVQHARIKYCLAERKPFMDEMLKCGLLICQPGLYTPFEAMEMGVPFVLTYPMSFTQSRQGRKYQEMGIPSCPAAWANADALNCADDDIEVIEKQWFIDSAEFWRKHEPSVTGKAVKEWLIQHLNTVLAPMKMPEMLIMTAAIKIPVSWQKDPNDYLRMRFSPEDVIKNPLFCNIKTPKDCRNAVEQLEDCVKNGRLYQAAEITDQLTYFGQKFLSSNNNLNLRVKIERLKRCGYLQFRDYEIACRDDLLTEINFDDVLNGRGTNRLRFYLFTVIGTPLWHEPDKNLFLAGLNKCELLYENVTDFKNKQVLRAFLFGLIGRKKWFEKRQPSEIVMHFDEGIALCSESHPRTILHLIIYCMEQLVNFFGLTNESQENVSSAKKLFEKKLIEFRNIRLTRDRVGSTLLHLRYLMLQLEFLLFELKQMEVKSDLVAIGVLKRISAVKVDLWFATRRAGLNELKPASSLLADIQKLITDQNMDFVDAQDTVVLATLLREIDWREMEKIAKIYMEACGYDVEEMPGDYPAIDLICTHTDGLGRKTKTGIQVKHFEKPLKESNYKIWIDKLNHESPENRKSLSHFQFFVKTRSNWMNENKVNNLLELLLPALVSKVEFTSLDTVAEKILSHPACLPAVLDIINLAKAKADFAVRANKSKVKGSAHPRSTAVKK